MDEVGIEVQVEVWLMSTWKITLSERENQVVEKERCNIQRGAIFGDVQYSEM